MRAISLLVAYTSATAPLARALIFTLPTTTVTPGNFTFTFQSEASDPAGNITFWLGHESGAGGYFDVAQNVPQDTSKTSLTITILDEAGDGQQWNLNASPPSNLPGDFYATSDLLTINAAGAGSSTGGSSATSSGDSSLTGASSPAGPTATSPASSKTSPTSATNAPAGGGGSSNNTGLGDNTSTGSALSSASPTKSSSADAGGVSASDSSPSPGLIAGATVGSLVVISLVLAALFWWRRARRHRQLEDDIESRAVIDPAFLPSPYLTATPGSSSLGHGLAVEPSNYNINANSNNRNTSAAVRDVAPIAAGAPLGKAATVRQEYLQNQLAQVQAQLAALQSPSPPTSLSTSSYPNSTDRSPPRSLTSPPGSSVHPLSSTSAEGEREELREQNLELHARIAMLETQLQSQWALGLSDEAPPGYLE